MAINELYRSTHFGKLDIVSLTDATRGPEAAVSCLCVTDWHELAFRATSRKELRDRGGPN